jgi:hypothetical protein
MERKRSMITTMFFRQRRELRVYIKFEGESTEMAKSSISSKKMKDKRQNAKSREEERKEERECMKKKGQ